MEKYNPINNPFLKNLWRWKCGLPEEEPTKPSISELAKSEWSDEFERLMRNRLIMGAFRYGKIHAKGKRKYDRVASILARIQKYKDTGNLEFLVDVANLCLLEFEEGEHHSRHFHAIDDGDHVT